MTRPCSGCGGTGDGQPCTCEEMLAAGVPEGKWIRCTWRRCLACRGSGQVEDDSGSDRDSLADAETLRLARHDLWPDYQTGRVSALDYVTAGNMLSDARAIPGLRGEER